jgi:hypothetical protein
MIRQVQKQDERDRDRSDQETNLRGAEEKNDDGQECGETAAEWNQEPRRVPRTRLNT